MMKKALIIILLLVAVSAIGISIDENTYVDTIILGDFDDSIADPFTLIIDDVERQFTHEEFKRRLGFTGESDTIIVSEILRVYDGDTFFCNISQWPKILGENIGIRINGIDTPEMRGSPPEVKVLAEMAKAIVYKRLSAANMVVLKNIKRGKYFRVVADVEADGQDLAQILIDAGLAKRYDGGTKNVWTIEDTNLIGE